MGQRRDRLAHCRQTLALDNGRVIERIFNRQRGLVANRGDQTQVVVGEALLIAGGDQLPRRGVGVDVQRAHDVVTSLQGDAQRFADAAVHDRSGRVKSRVIARALLVRTPSLCSIT